MDSINHAAGSPPATNITSLPDDLLIMVFKSHAIHGDDLASLRLVCSILSKAATVVLFHRIRISQLRHDRDAFLAICHSPHLAEHVREIEWEEISWYPGYSSLVTKPGRVSYQQKLEEDPEDIYGSLDALAADLFWLQVVPHGEEIANPAEIMSQRQDAVENFRGEFLQALAHLPRLSTAISRPMPADRTLGWAEYPFSVKFFQSHHLVLKTEERKSLPQTNDGLFLFLLPAIDSPTININRLVWEDESPASSCLREPNPGAFQHLDTLVLTLSPQMLMSYENLAANLQAATNVRNLSLGVVEGESDGYLETVMLQYSVDTKVTGWSRLHSLSLCSMRRAHTALMGVIKHNADTLRHVYLSNCRFHLELLKQLAEIPNLRLASFRIHDIEGISDVISETDILSFINKESGTIDSPSFLRSYLVNPKTPWYIMTTPKGSNDNVPEDGKGSVCSEAPSLDTLDFRIQKGPKWAWGRYYNESTRGKIYCYQVGDSHEHGKRTICWKFTSRDGKVAFGNQPLSFFDEWDTEAGDVEEPTPYCEDLMEFAGQVVEMPIKTAIGVGSTAWEALRRQTPPEGAIELDKDEAQSALDDSDLD